MTLPVNVQWSFVRKSLVQCDAVFTASDGSNTQPIEAHLALHYQDLACAPHDTVLPLNYNPTTTTWQAQWDTSASGEGPVQWMVYCLGGLQAAAEGTFHVLANAANKV